jgi:sugar phosphate permease
MNSSIEKTTTAAQRTPGQGIFYGWYIVAATVVGIALGYSVVAVMSFGTFIQPLQEAFGWSRGQISFGLTIIGYTAIVVFPMAGMVVDKIGAKKVLVPSTFLFGLTIMSLYFLTDSLLHFYAICVLIPILASGTAPLTYSRLIVAWFDKRRGLALGIGLAGVGIGTTLVPVIATRIMDTYSWREAYLGLGIIIIVLAVPVVALVMRNSPKPMGLFPDGEIEHDEESDGHEGKWFIGFTGRQAIRHKSFWLIVVSFAIVGLTTSTILIHMIPLMIDRGMSRAEAAGTFAYLGMALIGGRLLAGYLMDKFFAPRVVIFFMLGPVIGLALLADGATGGMAAFCAALVGMAIGAEFDVMGYFTSRYFGPRAFGQVYGYSYSAYKVGAATGPLFMGVAFDLVGRYDEILWSMSGILLIGCVLVAMLGPYPELPRELKPVEADA